MKISWYVYVDSERSNQNGFDSFLAAEAYLDELAKQNKLKIDDEVEIKPQVEVA